MFPDKKKVASLMVSNIDGTARPETSGDDDSQGDDLVDLADDFLRAVKQNSPEAVADAFRAMFMACESQPHEEAGEMEEQ